VQENESVSEDQSTELTFEEFGAAIMQSNSDKAPGLD
jgi:hypothetical protein